MKIQVRESVEKNIDAIRCCVAVHFEQEDMPNDYPHRDGETWDVTIDIATGQIRDWPKRDVAPLDLYMKVCDSGSYYLLDGDKQIASIEGDYVPRAIPGKWGDYVDFKIDANGRITNWKFDTSKLDQFFGDDD